MSTTIESLELEIISNSESAAKGINALASSLIKLRKATTGTSGLSPLATKLEQVNNALKKVDNQNKKTTTSFTDLFHKVKAGVTVIKGIGTALKTVVTESAEYTENMNLFKVSMGQYASEANEYAETVSNAMGIDTSEWVRAQGIFMTMSTGFGVASDRAYTMSKNLTQLGYDLSSFYNIDVETAMLKLKSGLAGELEPLRAIGYDLSQAKLEATAMALGIDKSVSSMTQAEKAQLRYYAIMTQVTDAHYDFGKTLDDPANQLRVFKAELNMAAREIGNIFIPALNAILPYAIAVTRVIKTLANDIAILFGFTPEDISESTGKVVENTDAMQENLQGAQEQAKKLKSYMLGIDELNVIDPNSGSEGDDSSGSFNFELPEYDFMEKLADSKIAEIVEDMKEWLGITEGINSWSDLLGTKLGGILTTVGAVGLALLAWKVTEGFESAIKMISNLSSVGSFTLGLSLAVIGITIGALAIESALTEGLNGVNITQLLTASASIIAGGALIGKTFGATMIGAAVSAIIVGLVGFGVGLYDAITNELNVTNALTIAFATALIGLGITALIPAVATGMGAVVGAIIGAALVGSIWIIQNTEDTITKIGSIIAAAALAVGAILAFSGANVPLGIGLMVAGAVTMGSAIALNTDSLSDDVKEVIAVISGAVSVALLAVGAILAFTGVNIALGIALMAGGAVTLATVVAPNWNYVKDALEGPVGDVVGIVSGALLALGAILAFTGFALPLGIALMAAGAVGLVTVAVVNWDSIKTALEGPVGAIAAILGGALLVLGAILLFTGVGIPLGIGLMVAGAASLGTAVAFNWDFLKDKVKEIWDNIKDFWKKNIAPIFTAKWWKDLGKTCINGLIGGFESGINGIIGAFESMINWIVDGLNKISFDIPDWLGGGSFGINLPRANFGRVSIPRLAEGGFPETGQMFIAREAGAEMVGSIGRKTAVANNDQIVSGIAGGVAQANEEQNVLLREQNSLLRAILEKDSGVYLDGKSLTNSVEKYQRERGRVLIAGGVI